MKVKNCTRARSIFTSTVTDLDSLANVTKTRPTNCGPAKVKVYTIE